MRDQALRNRLIFVLKPSRVLGFMLSGEAILFLLFVIWVSSGCLICPVSYRPPVYESQKWILTGGAMTAMFGWTVSAFVTVRNSVKQHTINTLLQSRLSATYMERAETLSKFFTKPDGSLILVNEDDIVNPESQKKMEALRYVLNYFEFISVGVRHGDLDEDLLKSSLRGMLCKVFWMAQVHVQFQRKEAPLVYEHLEWLYSRWRNKSGT